MVLHQENGTGTQKLFRIPAVNGDDDISAVTLSALMGNRDVIIYYTNGATTGCGSEPAITYITIF
jgi:peroxiredoxin